MAAAVTALDALGSVCLPKLKNHEDDVLSVVFDEQGKPQVYKRRWFILMAFSMGYFVWNLHTYRQTPIVAEFAEYFDTTNEFSPQNGELGIDFFNIVGALTLVLVYPFAGSLIDRFGLRMMVMGSILQAISAWWFYLSFTNYYSALASKVLSNSAGTLVATSFLRVATQWFPESERPYAVGIGVILSELGSGASLIVGPLFFEGDGENVLNLDLKSCKDSFKAIVTDDEIGNQTCSDKALDSFCCFIPTQIESLNLTLALIVTVHMIYTIIVTRDSPPTPPSRSGKGKKSPTSWFHGMKLMFANRNYAQLCFADFIMSGPPQVLFAALSRLFPPSVEELTTVAGAAGLGLAIPAAGIFAYFLSKKKKFYEFTASMYALGAFFWFLATLALAIGSKASEIFFLFVVAGALITMILWTTSVYELKSEYIFDATYNLEGFLVGVDRMILNLSALIFIAAIPPERIETDKIPGRIFTFYIGLGFLLLGVILVLTIPNKRLYKRKKYEEVYGEDHKMPLEDLVVGDLGDDEFDLKVVDAQKRSSEKTDEEAATDEEIIAEIKSVKDEVKSQPSI